MGILIFTAGVHSLIYRKSELEARMTRLMKKIHDLQSYAAIVGNGRVTVQDLLNAPGSMMPRTMQYLNYAHNSALQYQQQNEPYISQMIAANAQMNTPEMIEYMKRKLYEQGRDQVMQIEQKNLKIEETRLSEEKDKLQADITAAEKELDSFTQGRNKELEHWAPKYTGVA